MQQHQLLRYPGCKWNKHIAIRNQAKLQNHIPHTSLFNKESFAHFIERFPVIFLKPALGGGGRGIAKIVVKSRGYDLYYGTYRRSFINKQMLFNHVMQKYRNRKYIIQQGIDLIQLAGRRIDFRVIMLKTQDQWQFMGIIGKCAAYRKFVTNHTSGGKVIRFRQALHESLKYSEKQSDTIEQTIRSLSLLIASTLNKSYPNITELGLDIAIDTKQKIWLLEANTKPQFNLFKSHEDRNLYNTILEQTERLRALPPASFTR